MEYCFFSDSAMRKQKITVIPNFSIENFSTLSLFLSKIFSQMLENPKNAFVFFPGAIFWRCLKFSNLKIPPHWFDSPNIYPNFCRIYCYLLLCRPEPYFSQSSGSVFSSVRNWSKNEKNRGDKRGFTDKIS